MRRFFVQPFHDTVAAFEGGLAHRGAPALGWIALGCALGWWIYVPLHELMHAWGCQLGGGTVSRLDIAEGYGGSLLQRVFPYVRVGSAYAGQLAGFDTGGSDVVYAVTVAFPYLLTLFPGVPLMVGAIVRRPRSPAGLLVLGAALPPAWAPFLSVTGDYYELGAILASRAAARTLGIDGRAWRGDDVFVIAARSGLGAGDLAGIACSLLAGILLAFATYAVARGVTRVRLGAGGAAR